MARIYIKIRWKNEFLNRWILPRSFSRVKKNKRRRNRRNLTLRRMHDSMEWNGIEG